MNRVTVLGGSAAGVGTGVGCSAYLVERDDTALVLDLGPNTLQELRKHADFRALDAIVITHLHLDHILDLFALRFTLAYNPEKWNRKIPLWLPPDGEAFMLRAARVFADDGPAAKWFNRVYDVAEYDPGRSLTVGAATLTFTPTVHYIPCWAIRVDDERRETALVYTGDTGPSADLAGFARGAAVLIVDAGRFGPDKEPFDRRGHSSAAEAGELASKALARTLVLAHLWEEHGLDTYKHEAAATFSGAIEVARPGLEVAWSTALPTH